MANNKLKHATNLYLEGIRDGHARKAVTQYTGERYTQHSTGVKNGIEGFVEFFEAFFKRCPNRDIKIIRSIVDGQYVFVQAFQNINNGEACWITTDLFDTDEDDKIIEHWDVISAYETQENNKPDQINGTLDKKRSDKKTTNINKETIRNFMCDLMVLGKLDELSDYVDLKTLISHQALNIMPLNSYIGTYEQVFKIIGEGDFVMAYSKVVIQEQAFARFDLFRLEENKIAEHWVNQEIIPPKKEWVNGGKF